MLQKEVTIFNVNYAKKVRGENPPTIQKEEDGQIGGAEFLTSLDPHLSRVGSL